MTVVPAVVCDSASSGRGVITVAWSLPHTGGLPLTSLNVTYYREGRGPVVKTVDLDSIMLLLEDLVTGFNYSLTIRAGNAVGESYDRCPSVTHLIGTWLMWYMHSTMTNECRCAKSTKTAGGGECE